MPMNRMRVKTAAAPMTPSMATATAEARWADVSVGNSGLRITVPFDEAGFGTGGEDEKKWVGRAIRITPRMEMRLAY